MHFLDRFGRPPISISVDGNTNPTSDSVIVPGVTLDSSLQYDTHISILCPKAPIQINVLKRMGKYLNTDCRILLCTNPLFHMIFHIARFPGCFVGNEIQINWKSCRRGLSVLYFLNIRDHIAIC